MAVLYGNPEGKPNLEVVPQLKMVVAKLKAYQNDPMSIITSKTDAFDRPLCGDDEVLSSLQTAQCNDQEDLDILNPNSLSIVTEQ